MTSIPNIWQTSIFWGKKSNSNDLYISMSCFGLGIRHFAMLLSFNCFQTNTIASTLTPTYCTGIYHNIFHNVSTETRSYHGAAHKRAKHAYVYRPKHAGKTTVLCWYKPIQNILIHVFRILQITRRAFVTTETLKKKRPLLCKNHFGTCILGEN